MQETVEWSMQFSKILLHDLDFGELLYARLRRCDQVELLLTGDIYAKGLPMVAYLHI